jgi:hypothetical protein
MESYSHKNAGRQDGLRSCPPALNRPVLPKKFPPQSFVQKVFAISAAGIDNSRDGQMLGRRHLA